MEDDSKAPQHTLWRNPAGSTNSNVGLRFTRHLNARDVEKLTGVELCGDAYSLHIYIAPRGEITQEIYSENTCERILQCETTNEWYTE